MHIPNVLPLILTRYLSMISVVLFLCVIAAPTLSADDIENSCEPVNDVEPICGFLRPEDLAVLSGGKLILVSQYGSLSGARSGSLASYRIGDGRIEPLFPKPKQTSSGPDNLVSWGTEQCPGPPGSEFSPHGIHHNPAIASNRLLVINHGGREAIEIFEVALNNDEDDVILTWRGCVQAPEGIWFNDVVGLPDGSIIASHMMPRGLNHDQLIAFESSKQPTGYALQWSEQNSWQKLAGTDGALTNGLEVSSDGATLFINYYLGDNVVALDLNSGEQLWQTDVAGPDNSSWGSDGRLLVASHRADLTAVLHCAESSDAFCTANYAIVALDPKTGVKTTVLTGGGVPFGGATVAVDVGDKLFLGSFAGNRIAKRSRRP